MMSLVEATSRFRRTRMAPRCIGPENFRGAMIVDAPSNDRCRDVHCDATRCAASLLQASLWEGWGKMGHKLPALREAQEISEKKTEETYRTAAARAQGKTPQQSAPSQSRTASQPL